MYYITERARLNGERERERERERDKDPYRWLVSFLLLEEEVFQACFFNPSSAFFLCMVSSKEEER